MIPLQAMACGTLVAATNFAGPTHYLRPGQNALTWEATVGTSPAKVRNTPDTARWGHLRTQDIADAMRAAVGDGTAALVRGGFETAARYTWRAAGEELLTQIERHVAQVRRRQVGRPVGSKRPGSLTVIAPVRNGAQHVRRFAESALRTVWPGEVRVVLLDDASEDGAALALEAAACGAAVSRTDAWLGEWGQRARSAQFARDGHVFLTDVDVEFADMLWAEKCFATLQEQPCPAVVHPVMLRPDGTVWSAGGTYRGNRPCCHERAGERLDGNLSDAEITYAPGAGWFLSAPMLAEACAAWVGGYFPTYFADVDMALWLRTHGARFVRCGSARVVHHHGSYTDQQMEAQKRVFERNAAELDAAWGDFCAHDKRVKELLAG